MNFTSVDKFRVLLIGDLKVGKSNIYKRLARNYKFDSAPGPFSLGFELITRDINVADRKIRIQYWDSSGDARFRKLTMSGFQEAHAFLLVYDITNRESFDNISDWVKEIKGLAKEGVRIILIGNKCDLEEERQVSYEEGRMAAEGLKAQFFEISGRTRENMDYMEKCLVNGFGKENKENKEDGAEKRRERIEDEIVRAVNSGSGR